MTSRRRRNLLNADGADVGHSDSGVAAGRTMTGGAPLDPEPHLVAPWLDHFVLLEQLAGEIRIVELQLIPALLQTEAYAIEVERTNPWPVTDEQVAKRVELRLDRQQVLRRQGTMGPTFLSVILPVDVLRNQIGSAELMAEQLDHLARMARRSNVDLRLITDGGVVHHAISSFELLVRPEPKAVPLARTLDLAGVHYHESWSVTAKFAWMFDHLRECALPPDESIELIEATRRSYE